MGQTTEELNTDIAGTRDTLAADLDALQDRVSPNAIIERRKVAARGRIDSLRSQIMGSSADAKSSVTDTIGGGAKSAVGSAGDSVQGSPLGVGLVAFGAGMIISALLPASQPEARAAQKLVEVAKEHGQPLVDEAKSVGQEIGSDLQESATDAAQQVKSSAQESAQRVQEEGKSSADEVKTQAQQS